MFRIRIRQHERGLLFRHGDFRRLMRPGAYWLWRGLWSPRSAWIEIVDTLQTRFSHELLDFLLGHAEVRDALRVVDLKDDERALLWKDGRLAYILGPGRHAFWRTPHRLEVEVFNVSDFKFDHVRLEAILVHPGAKPYLEYVRVEPHERTLLFREGELVGTLNPGRYAFWKHAGRIVCKTVDLREQLLDVAGQEIMTHDKVTLRVNLLVTYRVGDPVEAATVVSDHAQALYREAQLALRAAIGGRALDALLTDKETVGAELADVLSRRARSFGVEVRGVGLRDIILPGEMKTILNQVIEAEKQAQANLIRRREETAAARSQANTAKLISENPTLARMKELEAVADILAGSRATFVFGKGDLTEQFRGLVDAIAGQDE